MTSRLSPRRRHFVRHAIPAAIVASAFLVIFLVTVVRENVGRRTPIGWGVTFSTKYARELGIEWREAYLAMLDELGVTRVRIPIHWDEVEREPGSYRFEEIDWMLTEAAKRDVSVLLVVGRRTPRWPECHTPSWAAMLGLERQNERVLELVRREVERFKSAPAVVGWQVENEPLLDVFGVCPPGDVALLGKERRIVKELDPGRPVVITDSGELSLWLPAGLYADVLGISMYRVTWNRWLGYFYYPITPAFYQRRASALFPIIKKVIITELQAEPWPSRNRAIPNVPLGELYETMNIPRLRSNIEFARRVGFSEVYLWGVEWWYWVRAKGDSSFWNEARALFMGGK